MSLAADLSLAAAVLAVIALIAAVLAGKAAREWRVQRDSLETSIDALRREVELLASISARTGRRVQRVEHEFSGVTERVDLVEARAAPGVEALDQAIDLARQGADSDRLEEQFGLSTGEADLIARLHGQKKL